MTLSTIDLREKILEASVQLIEAEGLAALSMREVARRAGVSHQAPYHHFEDREAILAAIAQEGFRRLNAALAPALEIADAGAAKRLELSGRAYVEFAATNPAHFRVMFRPELVDLTKYPSAKEEAGQAFAALEQLVGIAVGEKLIEPHLSRGTVILAWAFVHGLSSLLLDGPLAKDGDPRAELDAAFSAYRNLLQPRAKKAQRASPRRSKRLTRR